MSVSIESADQSSDKISYRAGMRKPRRKLALQHETLRLLEQKDLARAVGGDSELVMCPTVIHREKDPPG